MTDVCMLRGEVPQGGESCRRHVPETLPLLCLQPLVLAPPQIHFLGFSDAGILQGPQPCTPLSSPYTPSSAYLTRWIFSALRGCQHLLHTEIFVSALNISELHVPSISIGRSTTRLGLACPLPPPLSSTLFGARQGLPSQFFCPSTRSQPNQLEATTLVPQSDSKIHTCTTHFCSYFLFNLYHKTFYFN